MHLTPYLTPYLTPDRAPDRARATPDLPPPPYEHCKCGGGPGCLEALPKWTERMLH